MDPDEEPGALYPMSHAPDGVSLSTDIFATMSANSIGLDMWTRLYWMGKDAFQLPLHMSFSMLDRLCLAGLSPRDVCRFTEERTKVIQQDGLTAYIHGRFAHTLYSAKHEHTAIFQNRYFTVAFKRDYAAWLKSQEETPTDRAISDWLLSRLDTLLNVERQTGAASAAAQQARLTGGYTFQAPRGNVHFGVAAAGQHTAKADVEIASALLAKCGLGPVALGKKRWYHGCVGQKVCYRYFIINHHLKHADVGTRYCRLGHW